jgi:adenine-specific DNA-methyltransferase
MSNVLQIAEATGQGIDKRVIFFLLKKRAILKKNLANKANDDCIRHAKKYVESIIEGLEQTNDSTSQNESDSVEAYELGKYLRKVPLEWSTYMISTIYTALLPSDYRSSLGIFYTPPVLVNRLLDSIESSGFDLLNKRIIDPACGGGAFLAPIVSRLVDKLAGCPPEQVESYLLSNLKGVEIDSFGAWMAEKFILLYLKSRFPTYNFHLSGLITCSNSLHTSDNEYEKFDLVIGNPPYGKVKLSDDEREKWARGLYGHANYYGLFSDLGIRLLQKKGVLAYVMPSSFLGGKYFKNLRRLFLEKCPPFSADFVSSREGVFPDVLQEVVLMCFRREKTKMPTLGINFLETLELDNLKITPGGSHTIGACDESPWIIPRNLDQVAILNSLDKKSTRLKDLGYKVSTGPLVWNRHKKRLSMTKNKSNVPIVWAECVNAKNNGDFVYKCEGRNHFKYYETSLSNDPNLINRPAVLVQRTTSLEQDRRLVAAVMPEEFLLKNPNGVAVENHLNMILPIPDMAQSISMNTLTHLLNSETFDLIFRCINGSAAVSAYEIESLPFPKLDDLLIIESFIIADKFHEASQYLSALYL